LPSAVPGIIAAVVLSIGVWSAKAQRSSHQRRYQMPDNILTNYKNSRATLTVQLYQSFTEHPPGMTDATPFAIAAI